MKEKIILSFSSGKDSIFTLYQILKTDNYDIFKLFTVLSKEYKRVNFHSINYNLLDLQAKALGFNLDKLFISKSSTIDEYAKKLEPLLLQYRDNYNIKKIAFGDIFLEDLQQFRIDSLKKIDLTAIFPIWNFNTYELMLKFIDLKFKSIITCIDTNVLDISFLGRTIDKEFISDLPKDIDICGENGEYHSFVYDGPIFHSPVKFHKGSIVKVDNFAYLNLN